MDPLVFDLEATLKNLSLKKDSYLSAYQNFLVIKDSIVLKDDTCSIPTLINFTFETIISYISENKLNKTAHLNSQHNDKTLNGLLILLKKLLEVLDMDLLGVNHLYISQVIIEKIVNIMTYILKSHINTEITHLISALTKFCSVIDCIKLNSQIIESILELIIGNKLNNRQKLNLQECFVALFDIMIDNSAAILLTHKFIIIHTLECGRKLNIDQTCDDFNERIITSLNILYLKLIKRFDKCQIKEYIETLVILSTSKQYKHISPISLNCLSSQRQLFENETLNLELIWIPFYIIEKLVNNIQIKEENSLIKRYFMVLNSCLSSLIVFSENKDQLKLQICINDFIHIFKQFISGINFEVHLVILSSIYELILNIKELILSHNIESFISFQFLLSKLLPILSSMLEDYKYKPCWVNLINLLILLIDSWDELSITQCFYESDMKESLLKLRLYGSELFENVIHLTLSMAATSICRDVIENSAFSFSDVFVIKEELKQIVGSITRTFGPKVVLKFMPLSFDGILLTDPKFAIKSNSWLLPLLRIYTTRTELRYFVDHFLPIALELNKYVSESQKIEPDHVKLYKILEEQIWSLLPNFFDEVLDFPEVFSSEDGILRTYMVQLLDRNITKDYICNALLRISKQTFIGRGLSLKNGDEFREAQRLCNIDNRKYYVIQKLWKSNAVVLNLHSKTFLSLLIVKFLNSYSQEQFVDQNSNTITEKESQYYLTCIQSLVPFCDENVLQTNLKNFYSIWNKLTTSVEHPKLPFSLNKIIALLDVTIAMIRNLPLNQINNILESFKCLLKAVLNEKSNKEKLQLQKKLYKGLRVCLDTLRIREQRFLDLKDGMITLWNVLLLDNGKCPAGSLKHRLSCLRVFIQLFKRIEDREFVSTFIHKYMINAIIPEVLFGIREFNAVVRMNALNLIKSLIECCADDQNFLETIIVKIITLSRIKLNQVDNYLISSCIIVITRIIIDYGDIIQKLDFHSNNSLLEVIFYFVINSLSNQDALIYLNALKSIKVCLFKLESKDFWNYIPNIILNILENEKCALKHRIQVRKILISIIRKFGIEDTFHVFPKEHLPLYRYLVRKIKHSSKTKTRALMNNNQDQSLFFLEKDFEHVDDSADPNNCGGILDALQEDDDYFDEHNELFKNTNSDFKLKRKNKNEIQAFNKLNDPAKSLTIIDGYSNISDPIDLLSSEASSKIVTTNSKNTLFKKKDLEDETVEFDKELDKIIVKDNIQNENLDDTTNSFEMETRLNIRKSYSESFRNRKKSLKRNKQHLLVKSSKEFKSKKAHGDIIKNGQQPFAYLRLNPILSKERHRLNATRSFENIFFRRKKKNI